MQRMCILVKKHPSLNRIPTWSLERRGKQRHGHRPTWETICNSSVELHTSICFAVVCCPWVQYRSCEIRCVLSAGKYLAGTGSCLNSEGHFSTTSFNGLDSGRYVRPWNQTLSTTYVSLLWINRKSIHILCPSVMLVSLWRQLISVPQMLPKSVARPASLGGTWIKSTAEFQPDLRLGICQVGLHRGSLGLLARDG